MTKSELQKRRRKDARAKKLLAAKTYRPYPYMSNALPVIQSKCVSNYTVVLLCKIRPGCYAIYADTLEPGNYPCDWYAWGDKPNAIREFNRIIVRLCMQEYRFKLWDRTQ